ncbi:SDR family NAD(P)-dependent oxidoreductase [Paraflavisolibacter sp. H34]|uniref:SDR family NAD(P)-dependent oxidoreductase n=1 Tax=Huijunlia imazamoxiresistens TaxID=3127457 RepID=UPI003016B396
MSNIKGSNILITGGTAGIGKALADRVLELGAASVTIWGTNRPRLEQALGEWRRKGYKVFGYTVDISDAQAVLQTAALVLEEAGLPDILVNNAGIAVRKPFWEHAQPEMDRIIATNIGGSLSVTRAFLPAMINRGSGHIVNNSSAVGLMPNPCMSVYAASKWAMVGWSESLRLELEALKGDFHVTTVTTSYVDTGLLDNVKAPLFTPVLKAEKVAAAITRAIRRNSTSLRLPFTANFLPLLRGLLPTRAFDSLIGRGLRIYNKV